jgi:predicted acetyltransferase
LLGHVCVQLFEKIPNPVNERELHAYVSNCYVIPEMRNHGLGRRLLNKALSWCRARDVDAVILWPSRASKSLYRRCGFAPSDILELRDGAVRPRSEVRSQKSEVRGQRSEVRGQRSAISAGLIAVVRNNVIPFVGR